LPASRHCRQDVVEEKLFYQTKEKPLSP